MPFERFNGGDQLNENQTQQSRFTPNNTDWQSFNTNRQEFWNSANQNLMDSNVLPNLDFPGINSPTGAGGMQPSWAPGGSGECGTAAGANGGWSGRDESGGRWENSADARSERGCHEWHHHHHHHDHDRSQFGGGESSSPEGNIGGGDLLADKLLSDPTMLQSLQSLQGQMTAQGFSALEQSLTQNLSSNPYTSDSALMQQAYQQLSATGASSQDLTALSNLIGTSTDSSGTSTLGTTGGDTTGTTGSPSSADPIIQQFAQSDPKLAQILTDSQSQMSQQGFAQFEQTVAQNWATGQYQDDASLLQHSLTQFQQQGGSTADVAAVTQVAQADLQNYGDSAVSTYQGTSTTSVTTGDCSTGGTTTPTTGDTGPGTTTTTLTTGDTGPGTTTTTPSTGDTGPGTTTTTPTTGDTGPGTTTTTAPVTGGAVAPDVPVGTNLPTNLVLSDSFNSGSLNTSLWSPTWFGNTEQQNGTTMSASNVSEGANGLNLNDTGSTGAIVSTNPEDGQPGHTGFSMTNGFVQFEVNVPANSSGQIANWPAFWLVGQPPWPQDGEIDVMEGLGGTAAWHQHYGSDSAVGAGVNTKPGENTYGVDITPTELTFYYDGQEVGQTANQAPNTPKYIVMENSNTGGQTPTPDTVTVQNVSVWE